MDRTLCFVFYDVTGDYAAYEPFLLHEAARSLATQPPPDGMLFHHRGTPTIL